MARRKQVTFRDLWVLRTLHKYADEHLSHQTLLGFPPDYDGFINQSMSEEGVLTEDDLPSDFSRGSKLRGTGPFVKSIQMWRKLGYLQKYKLTDKGLDFIDWLGANWRKYPVSIPIVENELDLANANYGDRQ